MHKKNNTFKKWLASLAMFGLVASGAVVLAPAANANLVAVPLAFITDYEMALIPEGASKMFDNINDDNDKARVTLIGLENAQSDDEEWTRTTWNLRWSAWNDKPAQPGGQTYGQRTRYSLNGGPWVYEPALDETALDYSVTTLELTGLESVAYREQYRFEVIAYNSTGVVSEANALGLGRTRLGWSSSSSNNLHAIIQDDVNVTAIPDVLERLDSYESPGEFDEPYLKSVLFSKQGGLETSMTVRIEFFESDGTTPKVYPYLSVNAYDMDNSQFVSFSGVTSYQLMENSNIDSVTEEAPGTWRFVAKDGNTSGSASYTTGRVMVNFVDVTSFEYSFGTIAARTNTGGSQSMELDVSAGSGPDVVEWTPTTEGVAPVEIADPTSTTVAASPVMAAIDVNPTNITIDNEIITILGANLNTVTDVFIGGVRVPMFTQSGNRLQVRAPRGLSGLVDLELRSSLNNVLMTRKLNFGGVASLGAERKILVVGGFAPNSRKLTPRMKNRIDRWLERNSNLGTLTCTGFTSLPRRTTDVTLSTNRGKTACNFSKRQRADLETSVSQGIEDPRPGSNVRRVRLVLTP